MVFDSKCYVIVRFREGEQLVSACVGPTVKHGGGGAMVWGYLAADTVGELFKIHGTLIQHGHSAATHHRIWFAISGTILSHPLLNRKTNPKHTSRLRRGCWTRKGAVKGRCVRLPGLHNYLTKTRLRWFGMSWPAEWRNSSQRALSTSGNSFKTLGKPFQVTTSWSWLRECQERAKPPSKRKVAALKKS